MNLTNLPRRLAPFVLIGVLTSATGCVIVEKKAIVLAIPENSKEVHLYYVFEGIGVREQGNSNLGRAQQEMDALKADDFRFFVAGTGAKNPLPALCRFEKLRFYQDPGRPRPLCADRRVTILDRQAFAKQFSGMISEELRNSFMKRDDKEFQAELKQQLAEIGKDEVRRVADEMGVGPLVKSAEGLMRIAVDFEADSIKMLRKAADDKFQWFRFEPHVVRLVFPVTRANAKRVAADPNSKAWLKEMRTFVQPIDLEATEEGLAIVVGKKSELIRIVYRDSGKHRPGDEAAMFKHAGSPEPILLDGKAANAEQLIERFVAEHTRRRAEPRKGPGSDE